MVAYSFKACFADQVASLTKLQTVRADRRRHAQVGERIQLYYGMRTLHCRKLLADDPICTEVLPIKIITVASPHLNLIGAIIVDGVSLANDQIEAFAIADGFAIDKVGDWKSRKLGVAGCARFNMGQFWAEQHGAGPSVFEGWLIKWGRP